MIQNARSPFLSPTTSPSSYSSSSGICRALFKPPPLPFPLNLLSWLRNQPLPLLLLVLL